MTLRFVRGSEELIGGRNVSCWWGGDSKWERRHLKLLARFIDREVKTELSDTIVLATAESKRVIFYDDWVTDIAFCDVVTATPDVLIL